MKPEFKLDIRETPTGDLMIKELRTGQSIPFDSSVSITILTKKTTTSEEIVKAFVHDHRTSDVINRFPIKTDGRYVVLHAVVPTVLPESEEYSRIIIYRDGNLYEAVGGHLEQVDVNILNENLEDSNLQVVKKDTFVLFNLWQCYLNYCKRLFEGECSKDSKCVDCNDEMTENRNLLWIFLNAIQYYMKLGEPAKAQELLENISGGCSTLCSNEMFSKDYNCGCGK